MGSAADTTNDHPDRGTREEARRPPITSNAAPAGVHPQASSASLRRCVLWHAPGSEVPNDLVAGLARQMGRLTVFTDSYAAVAEVLAWMQEQRASKGDAHSTVPPTAERVCLVIVRPDTLAEAPDVVETLHRHAPSSPCWWYGVSKGAEQSAPDLHPATRADVSTWAGQLPAARTSRPSADSQPTAQPPSPPAPLKVVTRPETIAKIGPPADRWPVFGYDADTGTMEGVSRKPQLRLAGDPVDLLAAAPTDSSKPEASGKGAAPALPTQLTDEELAVLLGDDPPTHHQNSSGGGRQT